MTPGQIASYKAACAEYGGPAAAGAITADPGEAARQRRHNAALRAHRVLGQIMQRVPQTIRVAAWTVQGHTIDIMLGGYQLSGHEHRAKLMGLAEQFGLNYAEHELSATRVHVTVSGDYNGVPVRFWRLVAACRCQECGARR